MRGPRWAESGDQDNQQQWEPARGRSWPRLVLDAVHFDQLREHGSLAGLRDENTLQAVLACPRQRWHYEPASDLAALAAAPSASAFPASGQDPDNG